MKQKGEPKTHRNETYSCILSIGMETQKIAEVPTESLRKIKYSISPLSKRSSSTLTIYSFEESIPKRGFEMDRTALSFLKELTESFGPAGFEREPAHVVEEYVRSLADEILRDKLGSIIFKKKGTAERPHVLLAGHVDEVGFVISGIDKETGFLTFDALGGWFDQVLLSQRVVVRTAKGDVTGVIAAKPPHLLPPEELEKVVKRDKMFIDVGATSREEAEKMGVRIGDPVVPWSPFATIRDGKVALGKAFDDRVGAFIATQVIRELKESKTDHPNTIYGAATVQEEVGARGATTVSHVVDPDVAVVLEVDISGDVPEIKSREAPAKMGKGPSILTYDASMIPNQTLKDSTIEDLSPRPLPQH